MNEKWLAGIKRGETVRFIKDSCPGWVSTVLLLLLGHIKCCVLPFCLVRNKRTKLHPYPLHTGPLNPQGSKSQQNIIPFNTISWGVFEFNLVPAPLKMTHYSAMMAKLSPIDSAVALKPCCGHSWQVIERERKRENKRARPCESSEHSFSGLSRILPAVGVSLWGSGTQSFSSLGTTTSPFGRAASPSSSLNTLCTLGVWDFYLSFSLSTTRRN